MSELVTITGATGFVGMGIAAHALNQGYRVRATMRNIDQADKIRSFIAKVAPTDGLEFVKADLLSDEGWDAAMTGATFVIHSASPLTLGQVEDESDLFAPAVDGTRRVLEAAKRAGVKKIVATSTALTIAGHITEGPATPADFTPIDHPKVTLYTKSKIAAEKVVLDFIKANPTGPEVITIHPGVIIGPVLNPDEDSESIGLFRDIWSGARPAVPDLSLPMADIRDVAQVHISALTSKERSVGRYMVSFGSEPQRLPDIASILRKHGSKKAPRFAIPLPMLRFLARFNTEIKSFVDSSDGLSMQLDISATSKDLGWKPISFEQSILDTAQSLKRG
jgi:dihydroflavonol-4-reductase